MQKNNGATDPPPLDSALNRAEYVRLAQILAALPGEDAMNLEEMDGFFAALICSPNLVPFRIVLPELWGGGDTDAFADSIDPEELFGLVLRRWNVVSQSLQSPGDSYIPLLETEDGEKSTQGNRWARGFMRGVHLCGESWDEIFAVDDVERFAMVLPILALAHENDRDEEMRPRKEPLSPADRKTLCGILGPAAKRIYNYFRPHRIRESKRAAGVMMRAEKKIGRNEPCSCGSGKKYKHCCGRSASNP